MKFVRSLKKHVGLLAVITVAAATLISVVQASELPTQAGPAQAQAQVQTPAQAPAPTPIVPNTNNQVSPDEVAKNANFCVWEYRYVCNPFTGFCIWQYVYICY